MQSVFPGSVQFFAFNDAFLYFPFLLTDEDGINVESSPAWLRTHRLLLLSENGELWTVDGKGSANSRLGERRVLELEEEKLTPYAQFKATVLEDATAFAKRESSYKHDKNRYVSKVNIFSFPLAFLSHSIRDSLWIHS